MYIDSLSVIIASWDAEEVCRTVQLSDALTPTVCSSSMDLLAAQSGVKTSHPGFLTTLFLISMSMSPLPDPAWK